MLWITQQDRRIVSEKSHHFLNFRDEYLQSIIAGESRKTETKILATIKFLKFLN